MEDTWLCIDEDISSDSNPYSDKVDSDIEAELYGIIHHHENLSSVHFLNGENSDEALNISNPIINQSKDAYKETGREINFISSYKPVSHKNLKISEVKKSGKKKVNRENYQKFSTPIKRKSISEQNSPSVVLCSDDSNAKDSGVSSSHVSFLNNKNKKLCKNSPKKSSLTKKKVIVMNTSDSSSESIIWTEPISSSKKDFKTNLLSDTLYISSTSEDSLSSLSPFRSKETYLKNLSMPNIKIGESPKDIWYINDEDLYRPRKTSNRYHDNVIQCSNCDRKGHVAKSCPLVKAIKCFFCGGTHVGFRCMNRMCSKCYGTGHESRNCWMSSVTYCLHCNMKGHLKKDCPDIWRRYHLTTEIANFVEGRPLKQNRAIYCFNCGGPGHFGAECKQSRNFKAPFPTWPCVISYDDPYELLNYRINNQRHIQKNPIQEVNGMSPVQNYNAEKKQKNRVKNLDYMPIKDQLNSLRQKGFPRSPKNVLSTGPEDGTPEIVNILLQKKQKNNEKRKRRRWNRRFNNNNNAEGKTS